MAKAASVPGAVKGCWGPSGLLFSHRELLWPRGSLLAPGSAHRCPLNHGSTDECPWSSHGARVWSSGTHKAAAELESEV